MLKPMTWLKILSLLVVVTLTAGPTSGSFQSEMRDASTYESIERDTTDGTGSADGLQQEEAAAFRRMSRTQKKGSLLASVSLLSLRSHYATGPPLL